ncbi:hypothetical protein [Noviherbaspirillum galbum]|uniref:Uncharacterized protein n=1 Tax=Noviherbaspirillum galbum TaxID=2709383 RepID=A0A6B3SVI6_9BURK|nr:hypothetical protein [Noviherbaspirillum galbum]NEX62392.1 hypothetical protein [Noviherbaspirillum galbum]
MMDRESIFNALSRMTGPKVDHFSMCELYAATLADIAERVSNDEMRRLLLIGAYLFDRETSGNETDMAEHARWGGRLRLVQ